MRNKLVPYLFASLFGVIFSACSGNDDYVPINIPATNDEVCCTQDDENKISQILAGYKELTGLSRRSAGDYTIKVYGRNASLSVGYNDLYFTVEKTESGRHVKDIAISDLSPLMDMGKMKHSTPIANKFDQIESFPIYHTWVAPLMAGGWTLSFNYRIRDEIGSLPSDTIKVIATPEGQAWIKSFKWNDATYYLTLVSPQDLQTGVNTISAYISKKSDDATQPYLPASEVFTIDIYPTMPDMGDHTSPNNEPLTLQEDGNYQGKLNLTMTGVWNIHLHVKDAGGNTVAGGEELSELYWIIDI